MIALDTNVLIYACDMQTTRVLNWFSTCVPLPWTPSKNLSHTTSEP